MLSQVYTNKNAVVNYLCRLAEKSGNDDMSFALNWAARRIEENTEGDLTKEAVLRKLNAFDEWKIKSGCPACTGEDPSCNKCRAAWLAERV